MTLALQINLLHLQFFLWSSIQSFRASETRITHTEPLRPRPSFKHCLSLYRTKYGRPRPLTQSKP